MGRLALRRIASTNSSGAARLALFWLDLFFRVEGLGFRGLRFRGRHFSDLGFWGVGFWVVWGIRALGLRLRVQGLRDSSARFGV